MISDGQKIRLLNYFKFDQKLLEKQLLLPIEYSPNGRPAFLQPDEAIIILLKIGMYHNNG